VNLPVAAWQYFRMKNYYDHAKRIVQEVASNHRAGLAGGVAAAGGAAMAYDNAFELGRQAYRYGRRALGIHDMVENADANSDESKHRRRVIGNAQRKVMQQLNNSQI